LIKVRTFLKKKVKKEACDGVTQLHYKYKF